MALMGAEYVLRRTGPMAVGASTVGAFFRSGPQATEPDVQLHFFAFSTTRSRKRSGSVFGVQRDRRPAPAGEPRPRHASLGQSLDEQVTIQANYLDADADQKVLVDAMQFGHCASMSSSR